MSCRIHDSGLGAAPFAVRGAALSVAMERLPVGASAALSARGGPEEMVALLEGSATLRADDGEHALVPGTGVLIPAGSAREWTILTPALVYRVRAAG
ncbi:hypothetical protein [Pararhodobacter aggregans]|uniref:hypothetical protein n=1 Tax=Pararhodobacter aggregans TaxID=404875 RepID=UPI000D49A217|nr:hypothetical protein [Pararhodobacter aggregans]PTX03257.1 hypothetical protein C8N33_10358 [Pararhodobacter aggregans]